MKLRTVGLRVALFGLLALVVGAAMGMSGEAGSFAPAEVLAGETVGVPTAANPARAAARVSGAGPLRNVGLRMSLSAARVSPFFATPALSVLRRDVGAVVDPCNGASPEERFRFENYSDTEWWIYTGGFTYYEYDPGFGVWNCIKEIGASLNKPTVDWFWYLYESDGQTPLVSCFAFGAPVNETVYDYPYGGGCAVNYWDDFDEYDCVGDEEFHLYIRFYGEAYYTGPLINDDGPYYGCAGS